MTTSQVRKKNNSSKENFRGFCFLTFHSEDDMNKALQSKEHILLNKHVEVKRALTKEQAKEKLLDEKKRKIFFSQLPESLKNGNSRLII